MSDFTFAEHGEDILVHRLLLWKSHGFYVDCGAYHSRNMSLTARLRLFGWRGLNIDVDDKVVESLRRDLPSLPVVQAALGEKDGEALTLYRYDDAVLNTTSSEQHQHLQKIEARDELFTKFRGEKAITTMSLATLLNSYEQDFEQVDFLSVDVEGVELAVLGGFPWTKYQPQVIAVEIHRLDLSKSANDPVVMFLSERGYILQSYVFHTAIFCRTSFDTELCHKVPSASL